MHIDFAGLMTPHNLALLVGGAALDRAYLWLNDKHLDRKYPEDAPHTTKWRHLVIAWTVAIIAVLYLSVQSQETHNQVVNLAAQAKSEAAQAKLCQGKMTKAISARDELRNKLIKISDDSQQATQDWLDIEANPPADIARLHTTDPVYQAWSEGVTRVYKQHLVDNQQQRHEIATQLLQHPLPGTSCE